MVKNAIKNAMGSDYFSLFRSHSFGAHDQKQNAIAKAIMELTLTLTFE